MSDGIFTYHSSLRARSIAETLRAAKSVARQLGVVRVTDTTRLDRPGVPVFASIRPTAQPYGLCVSAGKGLRPEEAEIGAYMEAIELALAEPGAAQLDIVRVSSKELAQSGYTLADFIPLNDVEISDDMMLDCVVAEDLTRRRSCLVPLERVQFPARTTAIFPSDTNGLASGNSVEEATVHALAEVIERDIYSMQRFRRRSRLIRNETLPGPFAELAARVKRLGFHLFVRAGDNEYRMPYVSAYVREGERELLQCGFGCHPWSAIAAGRAICEAFQSRLTVIHGGRDDLPRHTKRFFALSDLERQAAIDAFADSISAADDAIDFPSLIDHSAETPTLAAAYDVMAAAIGGTAGGILRVRLSPPDFPVAVVKVIVPRLEFYAPDRPVSGARMLSARQQPGEPEAT